MDPITLTAGITGIAGLGLGASVVAIIMGGKLEESRERIAARDAAIEGHRLRVEEQNGELSHLGHRCSHLRRDLRDRDQTVERLQRRIAEMEPDAERGRRRRKSLDKQNAKKRDERAARAGGNVTPIAKPAAKRAKA